MDTLSAVVNITMAAWVLVFTGRVIRMDRRITKMEETLMVAIIKALEKLEDGLP